ncbi:MAG: hypothetical protein U1F43_30995 [Myxococcota bacterium]
MPAVPACRLEVALAARLVGSVPVARFLHAAPDEAWAVLAWVDGVLLPELRRGPDAAEVGRALGRVLAEVGSIAFAHPGRLTSALAIEPSTTSWGATMHAALASDALAARVDRARQHALTALVDAHADEVADATDGVARLVHGDFRGNNVLVRRDAGGAWHVAAVLDWEAARSRPACRRRPGAPLSPPGVRGGLRRRPRRRRRAAGSRLATRRAPARSRRHVRSARPPRAARRNRHGPRRARRRRARRAPPCLLALTSAARRPWSRAATGV